MKKSSYILWIFALAGVLSAQAQNIVEVKPDKKIVHVEQLGLNPSSNVRDALDIMPDLLNRNTDDVLNNFSLQVDGKDVGNSADVVLMQTILAEVDVIEVSTSPAVSEQKNGQGGVINIKTKAPEEGFHGDVLLDGATSWDVMPSVLLSYKKDKWSLKGSVMMEYFNSKKQSYLERQSPTSLLVSRDTTHTRYRQETAKFSAQYQSKANEVKIYVWESLAFGDHTTRESLSQETPVPDRENYYRRVSGTDTLNVWQRDLSVVANVEYKHTFSNNGTFETSARYDYSPTKGKDDVLYDSRYYILQRESLGGVPSSYLSSAYRQPHQLDTEVKTKQTLGNWGENHNLELEGGLNYQLNASATKSTEDFNKEGMKDYDPEELNYSYMGHYLSPFLTFTYNYRTLTLKLGARYQYQNQSVNSSWLGATESSETANTFVSHDWVANANINWAVAPHHNLRLLGGRNLVRPSVEQLTPILHYNQRQDIYMQGNPALQPMQLYNADLDYCFDFQNEKHNLLLDVGLSYIRTESPINQVMREDSKRGLVYNTYINASGEPANILDLNLLLCYKVGVYTLMFTGNTFYKLQQKGMDLKGRLYYNLAMANNFNFAKGWALSFKLIYNSEEWTENEIIGDCLLANLRLAKSWGNWLVHAEINDIFDYTSADYSKNGGETIKRIYDPHRQCVAVGFAYKF